MKYPSATNQFGIFKLKEPTIAAAGGTIDTSWDLARALGEGDKATGVPELMELYSKMRAKPVDVDLPALWKRLGIERRGGKLIFDDRAPLANVRRAITTGKNR